MASAQLHNQPDDFVFTTGAGAKPFFPSRHCPCLEKPSGDGGVVPHRDLAGLILREALVEARVGRVLLTCVLHELRVEVERRLEPAAGRPAPGQACRPRSTTTHVPPNVFKTVVNEAPRSPQPGFPRRQMPAIEGELTLRAIVATCCQRRVRRHRQPFRLEDVPCDTSGTTTPHRTATRTACRSPRARCALLGIRSLYA